MRKKKSYVAPGIVSGEQDFLKLPSLAGNQTVSSHEEEDVCGVFVKLSKLHYKLKDPLKELFYQCACEDEGECYLASSSEKLSTKKDLPQEVYLSPQPDHVPLWKRNISNKLAVEYRKLRVNRKGTPISTVVVRWIRRNKLASYNHQSVMEELSRFGTIESVDFIERQTAIVVFRDIISACKVVNAFPAKPGERIQCVWHDKFMSEYRISDNRKKKSTGC